MTRTTADAVVIRVAAFRSRSSGDVVETGPFHDILRLPGAFDADLEEWEAGFVDARGRFLDRAQAAAAVGAKGRLEARSFFRGDVAPTLEAGHLESWRMIRSSRSAEEPDPHCQKAAVASR